MSEETLPSFLDLNFDDVVEPQALPDGEYELRCINAELKASKSTPGNTILALLFDVPSQPGCKAINHNSLVLPNASDDPAKRNKKLLDIQNFYKAFGINYNASVQMEDIKGTTGWAILGTETSDQYGDQNKIKRFVVGK